MNHRQAVIPTLLHSIDFHVEELEVIHDVGKTGSLLSNLLHPKHLLSLAYQESLAPSTWPMVISTTWMALRRKIPFKPIGPLVGVVHKAPLTYS